MLNYLFCNSVAAYNHIVSSAFPSDGWFMLEATGYNESGETTGTSSIYLADLRNGGSIVNNVIDEWTWLDLSSLGECSKIIMRLLNNDDNGYGMNVPSYFCLDHFVYSYSEEPVINTEVLTLEAKDIKVLSATISGQINEGCQEVHSKGFLWKATSDAEYTNAYIVINNEEVLDLSSLKRGIYIIKLKTNDKMMTKKLVLQ